MNIINNYSSLITAIFTVILAIATIILAVETLHLRKTQSLPIIAIQTRPKEGYPNIILLSITNCGNGIARNIRLHTISDFPVTYRLFGIPSLPLSELGIFNHSFDLGAGQKYEFVLRDLPEDYEQLRSTGRFKFSISADYEDIHGKSHKMSYNLDLELYHHLSFV